MKTIKIFILFAVTLLVPNLSVGQNYNIVSDVEPFRELDSPVYLARSPFKPDDDNFTLEAGFHFLFFGQDRYSLLVSKNGFLSPAGGEMINVFNTYFKDIGNSSISYQLSGTEKCHNQIMKIQWKNMDSYCDSTGVGRFNFQVWINETTNVIEFHYGKHVDTSKMLYRCIYYIYLRSFQEPSLAGNSMESAQKIDSFPDSGTVYKFIPKSEPDLDAINIYPNPFGDFITVQPVYECNTFNIKIYDITGKLVSSNMSATCPAEINTERLPGGLYCMTVIDNKGKMLKSEKIVKQ